MSDTSEFRALLEQSGKTYVCNDSLPASQIELQFSGPFNGEQVVWNARLYTMQAYAQCHEIAEDPLQVIDIYQDNGAYCINIALNVQQIDQATIERTIIMIRKYKRLSLGRHEYGARSKTL